MDVIEMVRKVGGYDGFKSPPTDWDEGDFVISPSQILEFATLIRNAALEEAAMACEELNKEAEWKESRLASGRECADAIRAMKEQKR